MDLYRVLLCFRDGKNLAFMYRSEATSQAAFSSLTQPVAEPMSVARGAGQISLLKMPDDVVIADDYGNHAKVTIADLSAVVHTHVNEDLNAQQDLSLLQAHGQVKLNNRVAADPMLKAAMAMQQMNGRAGLA